MDGRDVDGQLGEIPMGLKTGGFPVRSTWVSWKKARLACSKSWHFLEVFLIIMFLLQFFKHCFCADGFSCFCNPSNYSREATLSSAENVRK